MCPFSFLKVAVPGLFLTIASVGSLAGLLARRLAPTKIDGASEKPYFITDDACCPAASSKFAVNLHQHDRVGGLLFDPVNIPTAHVDACSGVTFVQSRRPQESPYRILLLGITWSRCWHAAHWTSPSSVAATKARYSQRLDRLVLQLLRDQLEKKWPEYECLI
jgi:hypothetical protein